MSNHAATAEENRLPQQTLLEQILDKANLNEAWKQVRANKGAPGIDAMSVADFPEFARKHLSRLVEQIREG